MSGAGTGVLAAREELGGLVQRMEMIGCTPIVLYGAGAFAARVRPREVDPGRVIAGFIDDDPGRHGQRWAGLDVMSPGQGVELGARAAVIVAEPESSERMWSKRRPLVRAGMRVFRCPDPTPTLEWDQGMSDFYDLLIARENGRTIPYTRSYPPADFRANPESVALIREHAGPGGVLCEIGPGAGVWTEHLIEDAGTYHAVDYSRRMLEEVFEHRFARHLDKLRLHHDTRAQLAGVPDGSVGLLHSFGVFCHFKADLVHQFLASAARVLKPEGVALIQFFEWNAAEIREWEAFRHLLEPGTHSVLYYNDQRSLRASAEHLGLGFERLDDPAGRGFVGRFRRTP